MYKVYQQAQAEEYQPHVFSTAVAQQDEPEVTVSEYSDLESALQTWLAMAKLGVELHAVIQDVPSGYRFRWNNNGGFHNDFGWVPAYDEIETPEEGAEYIRNYWR